MSAATTVEEAIETAALEAISNVNVSAQSTSVGKRGIGELIEADRYLNAKTAASTKTFGLRCLQLKAHGGGL